MVPLKTIESVSLPAARRAPAWRGRRAAVGAGMILLLGVLGAAAGFFAKRSAVEEEPPIGSASLVRRG